MFYSDDANAGITGISLDRSSVTLAEGDALQLVATVAAMPWCVNTSVQWATSNDAVVYVDYAGNVTALSAGTATITAKTLFGGFTATCKVTVTTF